MRHLSTLALSSITGLFLATMAYGLEIEVKPMPEEMQEVLGNNSNETHLSLPTIPISEFNDHLAQAGFPDDFAEITNFSCNSGTIEMTFYESPLNDNGRKGWQMYEKDNTLFMAAFYIKSGGWGHSLSFQYNRDATVTSIDGDASDKIIEDNFLIIENYLKNRAQTGVATTECIETVLK